MFQKIISGQLKTGTALRSDSESLANAYSEVGEVLFRILTEKSFIGIYVAQQGKFQFVNPIFAHYAGCTVAEMIGRKSDSLLLTEDRDRVKRTARTLLQKGRTDPYEFRIVTQDGRIRWIMETVIPISYGGKPAILGNAIDITGRKEAEGKLLESEVLYRTVFETTGTAMMIVDEDATISLINSEFEKLSGYRKEEVEKIKKWPEFSANGHMSPDEIRQMQRSDSARYEFFFTDKQGMVKDVFLTMSVIPGTVKRIASLLDMTELRNAQEAIQKRKQELSIKAQELEELNATLKILLRRREEEKNELEDKVLTNIQKLVMPYLEKLKKSRLDSESMVHLSALESNLKDIASPFVHKLSSKYLSLTPKELQVAYLIKEGKTTKEIADLMDVGPGAIDLHRNHLRCKLGLVNKKVNLRSYLLSLE